MASEEVFSIAAMTCSLKVQVVVFVHQRLLQGYYGLLQGFYRVSIGFLQVTQRMFIQRVSRIRTS